MKAGKLVFLPDGSSYKGDYYLAGIATSDKRFLRFDQAHRTEGLFRSDEIISETNTEIYIPQWFAYPESLHDYYRFPRYVPA